VRPGPVKRRIVRRKIKSLGMVRKKSPFIVLLNVRRNVFLASSVKIHPGLDINVLKSMTPIRERSVRKKTDVYNIPLSVFCPQHCDIENCPPATCPSMDTEGNPVQTECSPGSKCIEQEDGRILQGELLKAVNNGQDPINEPCYDGQVFTASAKVCQGYIVCCVTKGTCPVSEGGIISSALKYYVGGCGKSADKWSNPDCQEQGECHIKYLEEEKGGFVKDPNLATDFADLPKNVRKELKKRETICVAN